MTLHKKFSRNANRKSPIYLLLVATALVGGCRTAGKPQQVSIDLGRLGLPEGVVTFAQTRNVDALSRSVLDQFSGGLANPGDDFQATDVIRGRSLPLRRLVIAGTSEKYSIIHYERGGVGRSWLVVLLKSSEGRSSVLWVCTAGPMSDLAQVGRALESGQCANELGRTVW